MKFRDPSASRVPSNADGRESEDPRRRGHTRKRNKGYFEPPAPKNGLPGRQTRPRPLGETRGV